MADKDAKHPDQEPKGAGDARAAYERPVLTRLGAVRDLTLSGTSGQESAGGLGSNKAKT